MVFDGASPFGKLQNLESGQAETVSLRFDHIADLRTGAVVREHHFHFLNAKLSRNNRPETQL